MKKQLTKVQKRIHSQISKDIKVTIENNCIVLRGELDNWDDVVKAGRLAVNKNFYGVINDIKLKGFDLKIKSPKTEDKLYHNQKPDVLVVGAGIVGCATARELAKYKLNVMVLDKDYDVAMAASSRNDGDIHVGIDLMPNMKKFQYNKRGNKMYDKLSKELDADFHRTGHIILLHKKREKYLIYPLIKLKAKYLKIPGVKYMDRDELLKIEPGAPSWATGGAFMPTGGEISPYKFTVAFAENAAENGVKFCFNTIVRDMKVENNQIKEVITNRGVIYPKVVINCAGVFADKIADMAKDRTFTIHPRKGTNLILDKKCFNYAQTSMNKSPFTKLKGEITESKKDKNTKGGGVVHTVDQNVLVGPTAVETPYREDNTTDKESIDIVMKKMSRVAEKMSYADVITYFSGTRAPTYEEDFVIRKGIFTKNIVQAAGIQSPGLTAAPAIAEDVAKWAAEIIGDVLPNEKFNPIRKGVPHLTKLCSKERNKLIKENPDYGEIICRCEEVSKGEILDSLNSPIPVYSLDAIKRRVRPGMGRCQGGFCSPLVMKILAEHKGVKIEDIPKANEMSFVLYGDTKGDSSNE
ncbi:MAG: FAD-dependent oxidoreductase [Bacillota bacterium]